MSWDLLQQQSLAFWLLAIAGVYLTGIAKSGFAGGTGVVAVPMMALTIDPKLAASMLLPLLIFMDVFNVKRYRGQQHPWLFKRLMLGSLFGIALGMLCFQLLSALIIKWLVGLLGLGFALKNYRPASATAAVPGRRLTPVIGLVSGFTSFIAHSGGPPLNGYLIGLGLSRDHLLATATLFLALTNFVKLPAYAAVGLINLQLGVFVLLMLPVAYAGVRTGVAIKERISSRFYSRIMNHVLLVVSVSLLAHSSLLLFGH